jgi:hypothetical protein
MSLKIHPLIDAQAGKRCRKKGAPRNEGISTEVYENKGSGKRLLGMSTEVVEIMEDSGIFYRNI